MVLSIHKTERIPVPKRVLTKKRSLFAQKVLRWYKRNGRHDLPWRQTKDPYKILVSEIMLQQTQVERVIGKYGEFLRAFPTLQVLAKAPVSAVIQAWSGMGYNRRALYLKRTAEAVVKKHHGIFPKTLEELKELPGVGGYTARALLVFAFGQPFIAPDVNVLRILRRSFCPPEMSEKELILIGDRLVTARTAYTINQSLMDIGRTICTTRKSKTSHCPLHDQCAANDGVGVLKKRIEPAFAGVPRRIWRGRIVEVLRKQKKISVHRLLPQLGIQKDTQSQEWIVEVLSQLQREHLIVVRKQVATLP